MNNPKTPLELTRELEALESVVYDLSNELHNVTRELHDIQDENRIGMRIVVALAILAVAILLKY